MVSLQSPAWVGFLLSGVHPVGGLRDGLRDEDDRGLADGRLPYGWGSQKLAGLAI